MSIVNSFINQIGRELGRDAYRSVMSPSAGSRRKQQIIDSEVPIFDQVINFELLASDEKTVRGVGLDTSWQKYCEMIISEIG